MCRFLESIKLEDGKFFRLKYHQERVTRCCLQFFPDNDIPDIFGFLHQQSVPAKGLYKCRVLYDENGFYSMETLPYRIRNIQSLQLVDTTLESMTYKASDRSVYNQLLSLRGDCDDVLLVRDGLLTDASYANIALYNGEEWITPRLPILYGTNRAYLLEQRKIVERDVNVNDLGRYQKIRLFNAMIEFGEVEISVLNLHHHPQNKMPGQKTHPDPDVPF